LPRVEIYVKLNYDDEKSVTQILMDPFNLYGNEIEFIDKLELKIAQLRNEFIERKT